MKRTLFAVLLSLGLAMPALAADGHKLGYVDYNKILSENKNVKAKMDELKKFAEGKDAALKKEGEALQALGQKFEKEQLTLTDAQKKARQQEFQAKYQAFQKKVAEAQQELKQKEGEILNKAQAELRVVIAQVARAEGVHAVLDPRAMLYADDAIDLTAKVAGKFTGK
jgi:outer membrane protein